jgi:selenocysteine lyase/cysteine desulfurase
MENKLMTVTLPDLDTLLQPLLADEEGSTTLSAREYLFPVTREHVYFNHASTGALPLPTARLMQEYIADTSRYGGLHEDYWRGHCTEARRRLGRMLDVPAELIAFTASTGDGLMTIAQGLEWRAGDHIVLAEGEFPSNVYAWLNLREQGVEIEFVPVRDGRIPAEEICARITERTRLISLSLVEFSTGFRNDVATVAAYCHDRGIICGIDAIQALGALDVNVPRLGVDFVAAAGHKWLLSPHICGILYVSEDLLARLQVSRRGWFSVSNPMDFFNYEQPLKEGAARFEHSSPNTFPAVGLSASLHVFERLQGGMQAVEQRILGLTAHTIKGLQQLGYRVVTPMGEGERSGIVCFQPIAERQQTVQGVVAALAERRICVAARGTVVRISPHFYNTIAEVDALLNALEEIKGI